MCQIANSDSMLRGKPNEMVEVVNEAKGATVRLFEGERFLLFQAFRNLIQNAIEFSNDGGKVEILDHGIGIPEFAKDRIFEKFYPLERPDTKRKSSGLGLSFVKEVFELHKGTIQVNSPAEYGRGTWVVVSL